MALKRYIPIQDTFIVSGSEYNYGADEILELGNYEGNLARILLQFPEVQIEDGARAILHLYVSEAHNLPGSFTVQAANLNQDWLEGIGRVGDLNKTGVNWKYTGLAADEWAVPGAISSPVVASQSFATRDLLADLDLDVTDMLADQPLNLALRYGNETGCLEYGSNISFYSKDTHTIYRPYLEIKWDDSTYETGSLTECKDPFGTFASNLRSEYTVGDVARVELAVKDPYAPRIWSTGSIYQPNHVLPETSYWGIKDEYTNEMVVDFDPVATKISADGSGSFFTLDTSNLEPERYYRLLVQVQQDDQKVIVDNKNIFRVGRNGKH